MPQSEQINDTIVQSTTEPTDNRQTFDVVIAGGGLSGTLSALALAALENKQGKKLSIAIVETNAVTQNSALTFDSRVLALSHGSVSYLRQLNVWSHIENSAEPIKTIHISDRSYYGKARIYAKEHQVSALGYVIEMAILGDALVSCAKRCANITWFAPDSIENIEWHADKVDIHLASDQQLQANLLLGCDGAQSKCREFAKINAEHKSYEQCAVIANVKMANAHHNIAYERFTENGPIAMLPLSEQGQASQKCSLVWTVTPEQAHYIESLSDDAFAKALYQAFGGWLGAVEKVGEKAIFPLNLVQAQEQVFHRMALIGNASHTIHPIAGQGFNLGLRDVSELIPVISDKFTIGQDIADFASLTKYAAKRQHDHQQVIQLTDSLVTLFSNDLPPLVIGRNLGLKVLNYLPPLKRAFVDKTMGY